MHLTPSQLATTLAALRHFQRTSPAQRAYLFPQHFTNADVLKNSEIDALCEALNSHDKTSPVGIAHEELSELLECGNTSELIREAAIKLCLALNAEDT